MELNKWKLSALRAQAEQIESLNRSGGAYKSLCMFLSECTPEQLRMIKDADIKWFSSLAMNFLTKATA